MRLINPNDCKELLYVMCAGQDKTFVKAMEQVIDDCPAIDAVPVVHCKDCTYRTSAMFNRKGYLACPASGMEITDDDFCSHGERGLTMELKPCNTCGECNNFRGCDDWALCCVLQKRRLCYENDQACEDFERRADHR